MKKILYLILLLPFLSYSQIIVTSANLPNIGDTVITAEDFGNYLPGPSGANQNWNFANVRRAIFSCFSSCTLFKRREHKTIGYDTICERMRSDLIYEASLESNKKYMLLRFNPDGFTDGFTVYFCQFALQLF